MFPQPLCQKRQPLFPVGIPRIRRFTIPVQGFVVVIVPVITDGTSSELDKSRFRQYIITQTTVFFAYIGIVFQVAMKPLTAEFQEFIQIGFFIFIKFF